MKRLNRPFVLSLKVVLTERSWPLRSLIRGFRSCSMGVLSSLLFSLVVPGVAAADDQATVEKLSILGNKEALPTRPGSAHVISEQEMDKFDYFDIHRLLRSVPGVNVQDEEGFGLRPNIGLRGGHPERSKKVMLMEDGVPIAPAPYSAPAAYYFPQMDRIGSIEVFKGVPSTLFGPNSIGGAINMVTRSRGPGLGIGAWGGQYGFRKFDLSAGVEAFGDWTLMANHIGSTGFKTLQNRDNTGFERNNVTAKWEKHFSRLDQSLTFKFNWSDEVSNETYAGLTDEDFNTNPFERYTATERDKMWWTHRQLFLSYALSPTENSRLRFSGYHHGFERSWDKLIGFGGNNPLNPSQNIRLVIADPDSTARNYYYRVLTGEADSSGLDDDRAVLDLGNNQRQFLSQGLQTQWDYELTGFEAAHLFKLNYRLHRDQVSRFHESTFWDMTNGALVRNNSRPQVTTLRNEAKALVHTASASYEGQWRRLTTQAILRYEDINYQFSDYLDASKDSRTSEELLAPGVGIFYQMFDRWGLLAGLNKGFNPSGPQANGVPSEEAMNYEFGIRHVSGGRYGFELIGFYSDYENLNGVCTQSGGCNLAELDTVVSGGETRVYGVEFLLNKTFTQKSWSFPVQFSGTYTQAEFQNSFQTQFPEWWNGTVGTAGNVQVGDPVPYIPDWQAQLSVGAGRRTWMTYVNFHYLGEMADQAAIEGRRVIDPRLVIGVSGHYEIQPGFRIRGRVDNLTDERYAVSRRPFGLRPGRPIMAMLGVDYEFF